jgi:hypothetical protein
MALKSLNVYHYFWMVSLVILIIGFLYINSDAVLGVNVGDTYYVVAYLHLAVLLFIIYFLTSVGYWFVLKVLGKPMIHFLTIIHCVVMFGWFIVYGSVVFYSNVIVTTPFPLYDKNSLPNSAIILLSSLIYFVAQPLYLLNIVIGIFRKKSIIVALVGLSLSIIYYI